MKKRSVLSLFLALVLLFSIVANVSAAGIENTKAASFTIDPANVAVFEQGNVVTISSKDQLSAKTDAINVVYSNGKMNLTTTISNGVLTENVDISAFLCTPVRKNSLRIKQ